MRSHAVQQALHVFLPERLCPHRRLHRGGQLCCVLGSTVRPGKPACACGGSIECTSTSEPARLHVSEPRQARMPLRPMPSAHSACLASCTASTRCSMLSRMSRRHTVTGLHPGRGRWPGVGERRALAGHSASGALPSIHPRVQRDWCTRSSPLLADAVHARHCLLLYRWIQRGLQQVYMVGPHLTANNRADSAFEASPSMPDSVPQLNLNQAHARAAAKACHCTHHARVATHQRQPCGAGAVGQQEHAHVVVLSEGRHRLARLHR